MRVYVTQYLMPDGRTREQWVDDMPDSLSPILKKIAKCGLKIEAEVLTTTEVSFTLACHKYAADYDILICTNGPGIKENLATLIKRFNERECKRWLRDQKAADDGCGVGWGT